MKYLATYETPPYTNKTYAASMFTSAEEARTFLIEKIEESGFKDQNIDLSEPPEVFHYFGTKGRQWQVFEMSS